MRPSISIVVPAYNESGNLEGAVRDVVAIAHGRCEYEIIIVDDGSRDGTAELADQLAAEYHSVHALHHACNQGFAAAYRTGLEHARFDYFTFVPGDHEVAPESLAAIFDAVGGADVVVPYHGTPWNRAWHRRALTRICTSQLNLLFGYGLRYFQGPAVYPTRLARSLPKTTTGFFFATEMLVHALAMGLSWVEVPLTHKERAYGQSKAVRWSNIVNAQVTILKLWWSIRVRGKSLNAHDLAREQPTPIFSHSSFRPEAVAHSGTSISAGRSA